MNTFSFLTFCIMLNYNKAEIATVEEFDIIAYLGDWYQIYIYVIDIGMKQLPLQPFDLI